MPTIEFTYRKETTWMGEPIDIAIRDTRGQDDTSAFQLRHGAGVHGYMYYLLAHQCARRACMLMMYAYPNAPIILFPPGSCTVWHGDAQWRLQSTFMTRC